MDERALIHWIQKQTAAPSPFVPLSIGDDTALLRFPGGETLVTVDMLMDGTHFTSADTDARRIGHKALAVNLSDIAAMGGTAVAAFVALAIPRSTSPEVTTSLMTGIQALAQQFQVAIAGGDTNTWDGPLVISITVMGIPHAKGPIRRSGARDGDVIYVTGPLGGSILGHHLDFTPRLAAAKALLDHHDIHAMIDLSDGLATDLRHILRASQLSGAIIDEDKLPLRDTIAHLAKSEAIIRALTDGEDFELCFTVSPQTASTLGRGESLGFPLYPIGVCTQTQSGLILHSGQGQITTFEREGYEHRLGQANTSTREKP